MFSTIPLVNKLNCKKRKAKTNWPSGKAHHVMSVIVKKFEPEDTMAKMEMERALAKLKLGPKKDPNKLMDDFASIECQYSLELSKSKKNAQVLRLGGSQYSSITVTTSMIHHKKGATLTTEKLLDEMHLQWHLAGGKLKDEKNSNNKDEIALAAMNAKKGGKKSDGSEKKENPNKDKTCNHCKKKGHIENTCWEKFPDKMPKLIKSRGGKQESKTSIAMAAIEEEGEIIQVLATQGEKYVYLYDDKISDNEDSILEVFTSEMEVQSVDISNAYQYAPIIKSVKYLKGLDTCGESRPSDDDEEDKS